MHSRRLSVWLTASALGLLSCGGSSNSSGEGPPDIAMAGPGADLRASGNDGSGTMDLAVAEPDGGGMNNCTMLFPPGSPWYAAVDAAMLDGESQTVIAALQAAGGWGSANFQIDWSIEVVHADANTPTRTFTKTANWYAGDCDFAPIPVPPGGAVEGYADYHCGNIGNDDCHLIVVDCALNQLFEMWKADIQSPMVFNGGCLAIWDMSRVYPPSGRGQDCTSADGAGFPIAPLLANADEVFAAAQSQGSLGHALRFTLPNSRIRKHIYVHPGTHSTGPTSGGPTLPPYGSHFRLRANYPVQNLPNEAARVLARTLMKYGMFLADGGNIPLTIQSDRFTQHKWAEMNFDTHSMFGIKAADFEMVDGGQRFTYLGNCVRNP